MRICIFYVPLHSNLEKEKFQYKNIINQMKAGIHPEYNEVVFWDMSADYKFMTKSTMKSSETIEWTDGKTYPVVKIEVSSQSHPFYTGKNVLLDTAGRVDKFMKRYAKK